MAETSNHLLRSAVIAEIALVFADVSLGDGITMQQARAIDDCQSMEHRLAVRAKDTEQHWREVPEDKLRDFSDVHAFLDGKGWVFYIPVYMIWVLQHLDDQSGDDKSLSDSTFYSITMNPDRAKLLNAGQGRAVCHFLGYVGGHSEWWREEALELCWGRFCLEE